MGISIEAAVKNFIGDRKNNEDNFYLNGFYMKRNKMDAGAEKHAVCKDALQIYGVFDGMGGAEYGEEASSYAVARLSEYQKKDGQADSVEHIRSFLTSVSKGIGQICGQHNLRTGICGSTAAMLILGEDWFRTAHLGDSRVYLYRERGLVRFTKDQSAVQRMVDRGEITMEQAFDHPRKNVITHYLGMPLRTEQIDCVISDRQPLKEGDRFLICSDGIGDALRDDEIQELMQEESSPASAVSTLVDEAFRRCHDRKIPSDNITALVVHILSVTSGEDIVRGIKKLERKRGLWAALSGLFALSALAALIMFLHSLGLI